jgi:hypothetical protein
MIFINDRLKPKEHAAHRGIDSCPGLIHASKDLLEYELRNYKQKMQQTANNLSSTKIIPEYLSFTLKNENTHENKSKLSAIIFEYEKQKSNDARELAFSNVFDFSIWMRSKLENVPVKLY